MPPVAAVGVTLYGEPATAAPAVVPLLFNVTLPIVSPEIKPLGVKAVVPKVRAVP